MALALASLLSADCAACHPQQARGHNASLMAHTLRRPAESPVFANRAKLNWTLGPYRYEVTRDRYRVRDGTTLVDLPILWAIGAGEAGQTWVVEQEGRLMETRASFYAAIDGLEATIGAPKGIPANLQEAIGRELDSTGAFECFSCHSAATPASKQLPKGSLRWTETLRPGVQCESCHTGTAAHLANAAAKPPTLRSIGAEEMSEVCGACHRTWADVAVNGPRGIGNVRFQPYRIAKSKCYDAAETRIACNACHDSHQRPARAAAVAATDKACASCHPKLCPAGNRKDCSSCHMPKYDLPGSRFRFTDHWIRTVRNTDAYPD